MLGARIEHLGPWTDRHNNGLATFSPYALQARQCTATIGSPVYLRADERLSRNRVARVAELDFKLREQPADDLFLAAPRHGVGTSSATGNTVLHGGWGVYRHQEQFEPYALRQRPRRDIKTTYLQQQ